MDAIEGWKLARLYPEVLRAHADFGGDLGDMLRKYHEAVLAEKEVPSGSANLENCTKSERGAEKAAK